MGRHWKSRGIKSAAVAVGVLVVGATAVTITTTNAAPDDTAAPLAVTKTLREKASTPGTAWAIDPGTNKVIVTADSTVTGERWNTLVSTVNSFGGKASLTRASGVFRPFAEGGDAIFAGNSRCSLGFNVKAQDGRPAFLTAGHCVQNARKMSLAAGARPATTVVRSTFPGNGDFALLTYDDRGTNARSEVDTGQGRKVRIVRAADARVGRQVSRMGSTTGLRTGRVTALNATVNYPEGTVTGLIQTSVCAEGGDSGGPLFTPNGDAIGLTSGGSGDCRGGAAVTFFQPVRAALAAVGARIA